MSAALSCSSKSTKAVWGNLWAGIFVSGQTGLICAFGQSSKVLLILTLRVGRRVGPTNAYDREFTEHRPNFCARERERGSRAK
jgi:hypothetical protein